ncbi:hypothetical protein G9A89_006604 [Geosiphon pyriformis]|nr:hypothetical protein G9A89_006604 [Geosiphon pyriformis]
MPSATTSLEQQQGGESQMFAVEPITDCPHIATDFSPEWNNVAVDAHQECLKCDDKSENWRCLTCQGVFCSRYVNGHMSQHNEEAHHPLAISLSDLSTWCYACDDYVTSPTLKTLEIAFYVSKFGSMPPTAALGSAIAEGSGGSGGGGGGGGGSSC